MVPPERLPLAGRLREHEDRRRYTEAGQEWHGTSEGTGIPVVEGERGYLREPLPAPDPFGKVAQGHDLVVLGEPAHLGLEARQRYMEIGGGARGPFAVRHDVVITQNGGATPLQTRHARDPQGVQADI